MSAGSIDRLYWLSFANLLHNEAGEVDDNEALFLSTNAQRGPPVDPYDETFTNYALHNIGNQLLGANDLFFTPDPTESYHSALIEFLSWVELDGNTSAGYRQRLMQTKQRFDSARSALMKEFNKANATFKSEEEAGIIAEENFVQWVTYNYPSYAVALNDAQSSAAAYIATIMQGGPGNQKCASQLQKLCSATNDNSSIPGFNMAVCPSDPPTITGTQLPAPKNKHFVPACSIPTQYREIFSSWQKTAENSVEKNSLYTLSLDTGRDTEETDFGHVSLDGDLDFSYENIFSFGTDASSNVNDETLSTELTESDVSIDMYWEASMVAKIDLGRWDISDPHGEYPNLKDDAPETARILVRPSKALIVSKLGFDIEFSGDAKDEFEEKFSSVQEDDGFVRVFGIPVNVGSQFSTTVTHTGTWDSDSGIFSVEPTTDGYATVLAIIGEKLQAS